MADDTECTYKSHVTILREGEKPQPVYCHDKSCIHLHCPFCPQYKGDYVKIVTHLQSHLKTVVRHGGVVIYKCNMGCKVTDHFHCPVCDMILARQAQLITHLYGCLPQTPISVPLPTEMSVGISVGSGTEMGVLTISQTPISVPLPTSIITRRLGYRAKVQCSTCKLQLYKKNIKRHMARRHSKVKEDITAKHYLACECIDEERGIFAVVKSFNSNSLPIHVQKMTSGCSHLLECDLDECNRNTEIMKRSGFVSFDCMHLQSLNYCPPHVFIQIQLREEVLTEIVRNKWFGEERKNSCLRWQDAANAKGIPFTREIVVGSSSRRKFVSVYEPNVSYYSRLGRVMVMYDTVNNTWHCACSKSRRSCIHKCVSKWHLFQTQRVIFTKGGEGVETEVGEESESPPVPVKEVLYPPQNEDLQRTVKYTYEKKKIPAELPTQFSSLSSEANLPTHLIPEENICPNCLGNIPLCEPQLISRSAKIVSVKGITEGISTYYKRCRKCAMMIRYQQWEKGLHNFNDQIILTIHFCLYLRNCLQTHTALSRVFETWELTSGHKYPNKNTLLHAYLHFEALTNHPYDFSCVCCGHHPPVVVMDLHKSGVFSMAVSEIENLPKGYNGKVDITQFWDSVCLERIARGFVQSDKQNPFIVKPSFHQWAPWIGPYTRKSNIVVNTEHEKRHSTRHPAEQREMDITEERLLDEISNLKVHIVRKLCKESGVDSKGSKMDLILRLREEIKTRSKYDKIFQKVWGASGGWAVVMCPCAHVVSLKFNIRAESPRDFADLLLSWKNFPNITVYDFARGLAVHTNLREPEILPFSPHEGRLLSSSPENILQASQGLSVSLPWLKAKKKIPDTNGHPLTGSSDHFCLYDVFHEKNTKDKADVLRRINLVPELAGRINSQAAEQLFSSMKKNNYFLNMLSPSAHIFMMRNIIHHYNVRRNKKVLSELQMLVSPEMNLILNENGQAEFCAKTCFQDKDADDVPCQDESVGTPDHPSASKCLRLDLSQTTESGFLLDASDWRTPPNHKEHELLQYVLDISRSPDETIVKADRTVLKRSDFWTLGLEKDLEATIANSCFLLIEETAKSLGINIMTVDTYVVPTWIPPYMNTPPSSADIATKDVVLLPAWQPGHWTLCVLKPRVRELYFLDSANPAGFGDGRYVDLFRNLAEATTSDKWTTLFLQDCEGAPVQQSSNDCGVFMLMYALYLSLAQPFDFSQVDMSSIRMWWCIQLIKRFSLECQTSLQPVHVASPKDTSVCISSVSAASPPIVDSTMLSHVRAANTWLQDNQTKFMGRVLQPRILSMDEDEALEAIAIHDLLSTTFKTTEVDEMRAPFEFVFEFTGDMHIFLEEVRDKQRMLVYCVSDETFFQ